jgi:hemerythrin superfamily protein
VEAQLVNAQTSGTTGEQDVVDVLTTDHHEVTELLGQIKKTTDADARRDMADTVIAELVRHSVAEEMFVYPAMREHLPNGDEAVEHDTEEHKELERTMKELEGVAATDSRFDELLDQLGRILADHVQDEETEQFPQLRARVPREQLVTMAGKVQAAKQVAPTRPHPNAPNNALFHLTAGPGVGLVDRLRDKLSGRETGS